MKIYTNQSVWDAAIERIEYIFDEFPTVIASFSGGKDSTVILNLALIVAKKKNRLPLKVYFLDQEAEWGHVIDYTRSVMSRKDVEPLWIQVPIFLPNSLSQDMPYLIAWEENKEWMREKEPFSIQDYVLINKEEETPNKGYWYKYFVKAIDYISPNEKACFLTGVRAEESPVRFAGLTTHSAYKHITYGKVLNKSVGHYSFHPLYDWCLSDIWKAIYDNDWPYCRIYDERYKHGESPNEIRVSNLHHETAIHSLFELSEVEPDTWELLTKRLTGINQAKHTTKKNVVQVKSLPYMFESWKEYRDYLTEHLIINPKHRKRFHKQWKKMDAIYNDMRNPAIMYKKQIASILVNDSEFTKLNIFLQSPSMIVYRKWKKGKPIRVGKDMTSFKYIKPEYLVA